MIKRKEKYQTEHFTFWLAKYEQSDIIDYDIIFSSTRVSPPTTKDELLKLADFIKDFVKSDH